MPPPWVAPNNGHCEESDDDLTQTITTPPAPHQPEESDQEWAHYVTLHALTHGARDTEYEPRGKTSKHTTDTLTHYHTTYQPTAEANHYPTWHT